MLRDLLKRLPREDIAALTQLPKILKDISQDGYATRAEGHWGRAVDYGELPTAIAVRILADSEPVGAVNLVWNAGDHTVEAIAHSHLARLQATATAFGRNHAALARRCGQCVIGHHTGALHNHLVPGTMAGHQVR